MLELSGTGFGFDGHRSGLSGWGELAVGVGPADACIGTSGDLDSDTTRWGLPWRLAVPDNGVNDKPGGVDDGVGHKNHHSRMKTIPAVPALRVLPCEPFPGPAIKNERPPNEPLVPIILNRLFVADPPLPDAPLVTPPVPPIPLRVTPDPVGAKDDVPPLFPLEAEFGAAKPPAPIVTAAVAPICTDV